MYDLGVKSFELDYEQICVDDSHHHSRCSLNEALVKQELNAIGKDVAGTVIVQGRGGYVIMHSVFINANLLFHKLASKLACCL